jgi:uncharacterized membrane protein YhiD involved in acid resistance
VIENLQSVNVFTPTVSEIILNLMISLCCSFIVSLIYRFTYKGPGYSGGFVNSIIFLSVITTLVIMIIGNNLARAFGLVGALSIIRFRTAVKDTIDIVFIFLSLTIGMASGVGYYKLAILGTIVVGVILIFFSKDKFSFFLNNQYMLQFVHPGIEDKGSAIIKTLSSYCSSFEMLNVRSLDTEKAFEYSFYVSIKKNKDTNRLINDLNNHESIRNINIFFDRQNSQ